MNGYRIFETEGFLEDLEKDFRGRQEKIKAKLKNYAYPKLRKQPYFGSQIVKLTGQEHDTWRYRIGEWRFFYEIDKDKKIVFMTAADDRGKVYKK
ncbi:hypothetical protein COY52_09225 [Candidatus Desantisbacteria bacterium CG_4_10_14_0_8_um_filter_48_22]|uniref:Type II toxin-antitoxin system RelE/ParE family toxin n=1 Tax=Candidatus Desantisbacteria bacterium CG_4_10_14_0_8_um_filter_48_22 TaxID=1974543 RepID=A0A2M7S8I2_9BACT|nr:MAG: hypothetical protein AUJ67_08800 [Candidatus Desantisbacteria bacterium CG1_02_49_89]PIV56740.1 MAG: hypothetical protein COS16_02980 [Candidatus Desantisbacteria bacterium CG02_land_8_20_14_3_00_49_13]PIZ15633.1 MAG: hypothetical protein COY52_09225 [Candidatus Desantisbacteria bacterium CG_4_10_14_0_8_um_filter_48_22]PJB27314.1 MAG: hypothetical protein CO111_05990 [Candidatus Desantisbacteria bacterium CG_4_9_14_3_um_filter_50_7]